MPQSTYDATDRAILDVLQHEGRIANIELAERVGLSPSACLRRTKALEAAGVISGYQARIDPEAVGLGLRAFVSLRVDQHSRARSRQIEQAMRAVSEVVACHIVSGEADFLVEVLVPDLHAFEDVLLDKLLAVEGVTDGRTMFAIRTIEQEDIVPLDQWVRPPSGRRAGRQPSPEIGATRT